ncbi:hypothetical protein, partial [Burkholderia pseudomallei]|uniref:hypothetical protein n=1 Tax=Burkholderia pseudomallei TaxID=28450 RepID=UPI001C9E0BC2
MKERSFTGIAQLALGASLAFSLAACGGGGGSDLPDFFGPFQSWRTASVASVEQYRCLNSSGV